MLKTFLFLLVLTTAACAQDLAYTAGPVENSPWRARTEAQIWNLEKAYWEYVKANDLQNYRASGTTTSSAGHSLCSTRSKRSHHRLDHEQHIKRLETAVVLN